MLSACTGLRTCVRARMLLASGEGCIDGRGASFAVSAVEVLKASGPQGLAMSQSPIRVTYGPAMTNTPGPLLWVWVWEGDGCNIIVHVMTEARPPWKERTSLFFMQKPLSASQVSCEGCEAGRII